MTQVYSLTTSQHPLIKYMKHWESFNKVDRKQVRLTLMKILASCVMCIYLAQFI